MQAADTVEKDAGPEAERSRERQRRAREQVIRPLEELAEQNRFAEMIRASLTEGRRRRA